MNKGWLIAVVVILIIVGSIGSAYMLRSVGSLSIDLEKLKVITEDQQEKIVVQEEEIAKLTQDNSEVLSQMELLAADNETMKAEMAYLKEVFIDLPGVLTRFGAIKKMTVRNGYIEFEIDKKEWLTDEAAMNYILEEFDTSIEQAAEMLTNGYYVKDVEDDDEVYRLTTESFIYLNIEGEEVETTLNELILKTEQHLAQVNYPLFSFYVIENEVVEVIEQYIP